MLEAVGLLQGKEELERDAIYFHYPNYAFHKKNRLGSAVRQGKWKLVALDDHPWELYDISSDRSEMHDLAKKHPEKVTELNVLWEKWAAENHVTPIPRDLGVNYLKAD